MSQTMSSSVMRSPGDLNQVVDNFTVLNQLGAGAMGEVFLARESLTNRTVALKLMAGKYSNDEQYRKRFEREIHVVAQLEHPNIAGYAGHGEWNGRPYLAVEYIPGATLSDFIRGGKRLEEDLALAIAIQIAQGLNYAHQRCDLIHRDIKPGNLLADLHGAKQFTDEATIKIIDFGLARARAAHDSLNYDLGSGGTEVGIEDAGERFQTIDQQELAALGQQANGGLTLAGQVMGTPNYMSPEQCRGESELTFSSDLYALGATLFHLITGRAPFIARTPGMVIVAHITEPAPDPGAIIRTLRPATRELIIRAMGKQPKDRHRSYDLFIAAAVGARKLLHMGQTQRSAPPAPAQRRMSGADFQGMIEEVAGDVPQGRQLSGADALREISTRMIRRNQPASGLHRRSQEPPDQQAAQPPAPRFAVPRSEPQPPKPDQPPLKPVTKTSSFFRNLLKPPGG